jgi:hypothetical protein
VAERYAEGLATEQERAAACAAANELDWQITRDEGEGDSAREMANCAALAAANDDAAFLPRDDDEEDLRAAEDSSRCAAATAKYPFTRATHPNAGRRRKAQETARLEHLAIQAALVRCVFGNPFRPVAQAPDWRTGAVVALAQAAYNEHVHPAGNLDPQRLSVLADALEEAGCTEQVILDHLRGPGSHIRGCWPLDLLLRRE